MIVIEFYGHKNVLGTHQTAFEFTKDNFLTKRGNCIIGIKAKFEIKNIKFKKVIGVIKVNNIKDTFVGYLNPNFNSDREIVIRKSNFSSQRTLIIKSNKAAIDINRRIIDLLKNEKTKGSCLISELRILKLVYSLNYIKGENLFNYAIKTENVEELKKAKALGITTFSFLDSKYVDFKINKIDEIKKIIGELNEG